MHPTPTRCGSASPRPACCVHRLRSHLGRRNTLADPRHTANRAPAGPSDGTVGFCVHHLEQAPADATVLYQQNHWGTWRSDDAGLTWSEIGRGLPSTFGFPILVPRDRGRSDPAAQRRFRRPLPPDAAAAVWRSTDSGATWHDQRAGLPQEACFFTVLRQGMAGDARTPAGVYFGTNSGSVFASADEGETWSEIARHLPTILSVDVLDRA